MYFTRTTLDTSSAGPGLIPGAGVFFGRAPPLGEGGAFSAPHSRSDQDPEKDCHHKQVGEDGWPVHQSPSARGDAGAQNLQRAGDRSEDGGEVRADVLHDGDCGN